MVPQVPQNRAQTQDSIGEKGPVPIPTLCPKVFLEVDTCWKCT